MEKARNIFLKFKSFELSQEMQEKIQGGDNNWFYFNGLPEGGNESNTGSNDGSILDANSSLKPGQPGWHPKQWYW